MNKIISDKKNIEKLALEKQQNNEFSKDYHKQIKNFLAENEKIQNEIKELDKKKNRLNLQLKKKVIEISLKNSAEKNEIKILNNQIKQIQENMYLNIKKQKKVNIINIINLFN
jgi:hypothetical protein